MGRLWVVVLGLTLFSACASEEYRYLASEQDSAGEAVYAVPPGSATGKVKISSRGIVELEAQQGGKRIKALHLRMAVSNQSETELWKINAQEQVVSFPNQSATQPLVVKADARKLPNLEAHPGELRTLDLYYPLPEGEKSADQLPEFSFRWKVQAGERTSQGSALFNRVEIPDYPTVMYPYRYPFALSSGPVWWSGMGLYYGFP
jgi:hypothetical protein